MCHIGSALSISDIMATVYSVANIKSAQDPERDIVVLSKGHAVMALYAALYLTKRLNGVDLNSFCQNATVVGGHPEHELPYVEFTTGSLGQGLSFAAGCALAAKISGSSKKIYAIISDGECNEGSIWEAAAFASQYQLDNLIIFVDVNGKQAMGDTFTIIKMDNLRKRWEEWGCAAFNADGHSVDDMVRLLNVPVTAAPKVLLCETHSGYGVPFMKDQLSWHYKQMNDEEYKNSLELLS